MSHPALRPGDVLGGRYVIAAPLGEGATSVVYRARDRAADMEVAVKVATAGADLSAELVAALEAGHPSLVRALGVGYTPAGNAYLVLELATGVGPAQALDGRDAAETVAVILDRVLDGLGFLHARGVVHGDVKPANIRVDVTAGALSVRLLDLGLARAAHAGGTLAYAAPECLGGAAQDARADLFSVGVVGYELLARALPFGDPGDGAYLARALAGDATPLGEHVAPGLAAFLGRLLQPDPAARYASAWEARAALRDAVRTIPDAPDADAEPRLVGRAEALEQLRALVTQVRSGRGARAHLEGPPGSGRSRLLTRATVDAALAGMATLEVRASLGAPEFLRALLAQGASLPGGEACAAALGSASGQHADPRGAWLDAIEALRALGSRTPLWIAVHDAGSADRDVAALLDFIARGEAPILWVGSWPAHAALAAEATPVPLRALTEAEVAALIASMLPGLPAVGDLARAAWSRARGLPGPVRSGVAELRRAGVLRLIAGRWRVAAGELPPWAFDQADEARGARALASMHPEERETLGALSLAGAVDGAEGLAALAEVTVAQARSAIEHGLAAGTVRREGAGLRVASAALGLALAESVAPARRTAVHRRALGRLADAMGPSAHRARSTHLEALGDLSSAAAEALRAARALAAAGALHEADLCFRRARALGLESPEAACEHGDALAAAGRLDEALSAYERAAAGGAPAHESALRRARALAGGGRFPEALAALEGAEAGPEGDFWRGWCLMMAGRYDEAEACARAAPEAAVDRARRGRLRGTIAWHRGDAAGAVALLREARSEAAEAGDPTLRAEVEMSLATALGLSGAGTEAVDGYRRASAGFRRAGRVAQVARCQNNLAIEEYQAGRWEAARLGWETYLDLSQRLGDPTEELLGHNNLGMLWKDRGELDRAEGAFTRALEIARARGLRRLEAMALGNRGEARALAGDHAAGDDLQRAESLAVELGAHDEAREARRRRAALRLDRGDARGALTLAREVAAELAREGQRQEEGSARLVAAAAARALGLLDAAAAEAEAAAAAFDAAGTRLDRARLDLEGAQIAAAQGDLPLTRTLATRAAEVFADLGARRELGAAQALARGRGQGDVFLRLAAAVAEAPTADAMLGRALDALLELTGADRGFVVLLAGLEGPRLAAARFLGDAQQEAPRLSHGIAERVIASRRPLVLTDVGDDADIAARASVARIGLRAALAAPLLRRGECLGLLYLDSTRGVADLARWGLYPLEVAAAIVGPALDLLLAREDERERAGVLVGTAHGLLDAVAAIDASLELVAEEDDPARRAGVAADARARCAELVARADGVLELVQRDAVEAEAEPVDLRAVARYALGPLEGAVALVTGEAEVPVRAEIQSLTRAIAQLAEVAVRGADEGSPVTVEVSVSASSEAPAVLGWRPAPRGGYGWARLAVSHGGSGLDGAAVAGLFDPSRGGGARAVGLCAARRVVRGYGGLLWAEAREEGGVRYVAEVPLAGPRGGAA